MTTKHGYCGKHQEAIKQRLHRVGLWKLVKDRPTAETIDIATAWLSGQLKREYMCPLVILMLEVQAKADRMAWAITGKQGARVQTCALCSIQRFMNDEGADAKVLAGMGDLVLGLFQTNGLIGGEPAWAIGAKKASGIVLSSDVN